MAVIKGRRPGDTCPECYGIKKCDCPNCTEMVTEHGKSLKLPKGACWECLGTGKVQPDRVPPSRESTGDRIVDCTGRHMARRTSSARSSTSSSSVPKSQPNEDDRHPKPGTIKGGVAGLIAAKKEAKK